MDWMLRKRRQWHGQGRMALLVALSALAVWTTTSRSGRAAVVPAARPRQAAKGDVLRLRTLNVFGLPWPLSPDVSARCERIATELVAQDVDVLALQEVWGEDSHAAFAMPDHHRAACISPAGLLGSTGLLTISRHAIRRAETRYFASEKGIETLAQKGVLRTLLTTPAGDLDVWNLHLQSGLDDIAVRTEQIGELLDWLATDTDSPHTAVLGDFNCAPGEPEFEHLRRGMAQLGFEHLSCHQPTYDASHNPLAVPEPPREIDHVFVRSTSASACSRRVYDQPLDGLYPSDHFGVEVTLPVVQATASTLPTPTDYVSRR